MKKKLTMTTTSRNKPFEEGYQDFIRVRTILRVSDATIKHYNGTYKRFVKFFGKDTLCNEINKNTPLDFEEWLQEVHSAVLSGRWCGDQRPLCGPAAGECQSVEFGFITTV